MEQAQMPVAQNVKYRPGKKGSCMTQDVANKFESTSPGADNDGDALELNRLILIQARSPDRVLQHPSRSKPKAWPKCLIAGRVTLSPGTALGHLSESQTCLEPELETASRGTRNESEEPVDIASRKGYKGSNVKPKSSSWPSMRLEWERLAARGTVQADTGEAMMRWKTHLPCKEGAPYNGLDGQAACLILERRDRCSGNGGLVLIIEVAGRLSHICRAAVHKQLEVAQFMHQDQTSLRMTWTPGQARIWVKSANTISTPGTF
ncbi:hypothetical protein BDV93DRAFT_515961 [Ceratobasidium sp. AG-I]|nr:hypothetical protein BDV93DRAFT_515961 [Ceratobasidium sp. AG-I]